MATVFNSFWPRMSWNLKVDGGQRTRKVLVFNVWSCCSVLWDMVQCNPINVTLAWNSFHHLDPFSPRQSFFFLQTHIFHFYGNLSAGKERLGLAKMVTGQWRLSEWQDHQSYSQLWLWKAGRDWWCWKDPNSNWTNQSVNGSLSAEDAMQKARVYTRSAW